MAVNNRGNTVSCPTCVGDGDLGDEGLRSVHRRLCNALTEAGDLADFLEEKRFVWLVTIDANPCRVVTSVLETRESIAKRLTDTFTILNFKLIAYSERFRPISDNNASPTFSTR